MMPDTLHSRITSRIIFTVVAVVTARARWDHGEFVSPFLIRFFHFYTPVAHLSHSLPSLYSIPTPFTCLSYTHHLSQHPSNGVTMRHWLRFRQVSKEFICHKRTQNCEKRILVLSCLSVRTQQVGSQWTDVHEI